MASFACRNAATIMVHGPENHEDRRMSTSSRPRGPSRSLHRRRSRPSTRWRRLYERNTALPDRQLHGAEVRRAGEHAVPGVLSDAQRDDVDLRACRFAPVLRTRHLAGHVFHHGDAAAAVPRLSGGPDRADPEEPRRAGGRVGVRHADTAPFRLRRGRPCRGFGGGEADRSAARPLRHAGPDDDRRPDRQRHLRARARRAFRAGAVHRAAHRLFAGAPFALHGDERAPLPELRAVHELPVLHRRVLRPGAQHDGRRRRRLRVLRRAGQHRDAGGSRGQPDRRSAGCRRCRPITSRRPTTAASP